MQLIKSAILLLLALTFTACQGQSASKGENTATSLANDNNIYERVDNAAFKARLADNDVIVLDVRTPGETAKGTIAKARQIDYRASDFKAQLAALPRDKTYLVYCQSGGRSARAAKLMQELGFTTIYELEGGYGGWE